MARAALRELLRLRSTASTSRSSLSFFCSHSCQSSSVESRDNSLFDSSLKLLETCRSARELLQIHARLITSGLIRKAALSSRVLRMHLELGHVQYAILTFECIHSPSTFCVNTVVEAYSVSSVPNDGVRLYFKMLRRGDFVPNSYTYVPLLGCCAKIGCAGTGKKLHGQAVKNGVDGVLPVQNSLIHMYGSCGVIEIAQMLFDEMQLRDSVSWNATLYMYVRTGDLVSARDIFVEMPEKNVAAYNILIVGYVKGGNPGAGLKLFRNMMSKGVGASNRTMAGAVMACGRSARLKEGKSVHGFLIKNFLESNILIDTALIDMYSRCERVDVACKLFDKIEVKNPVCWNAMILGHCIHGNPTDGIKLFEDTLGRLRSGNSGKKKRKKRKRKWLVMAERQEVFPDEVTFVGILCACARAGLLEEGRNYFSKMTSSFGIKPNFAHYWCMANLLSGAGLVQEAEEILRCMPQDDDNMSSQSSSWANLLSSCRFKGAVAVGEKIAQSLIEKDPQNFSYYQLLLNVYAVAGQWEDVGILKDVIKKKIGRIPQCGLVDLNDIVHQLRVSDVWQEEMQIAQVSN
ncbi:pentatricopeptide repeat-containing protein At3g51320 [Rhodamnia argentea]|uniref:Pentatricopeptide repeat-containing protein At3g51320 n=1 Tax=Rhodamnia argentea TaxID=178133 RepID=A0A8B8PN44_9MYRT|nr:pentatricopeptide repeat-containing protein At3g51320 [Rhodamnia argentea]